MGAAGLVLAGARAYWRVLAPIVAIALVAGMSVGVLLTVKQHVAAANRTSADLPVPEGTVLVPAVPAAQVPVLVRAGGEPVRDVDCTFLTAGSPARAGETSLRLAQTSAPPRGVVVRGRTALEAGEVVIAESLAGELDVALGEALTCEDHNFTVVGEMVDPADRSSRVSYGLVPSVAPEDATAWILSGDDYFGLPESAEDVIGITGDEATTKALQGFGSDSGPPALIAWFLLAAAVLSAAVLGSLSRRVYQKDLAVCVQLGASGADLRRLVGAVFLGTVALAGSGGAFLGQASVNLLRGRLESTWGQYWLEPLWSSGVLLQVAGVLGIAPVVLISLAGWTSARPRTPAGSSSVVVLVLLFAGQVAMGVYIWTETAFYEAAPWFGGAVVMALVGLAAGLLTPRSRDALDTVIREGMKGTAALSLIIAMVLYLFAFSLARADNQFARDAELDLADSGQRPGALVIRQVPAAAAEQLARAYTDLGGQAPTVAREVEWRGEVPEVVTPLLARCVAEDPTIEPTVPPIDCLGPNDWFGKVFGVGALPPDEVTARAGREVVRDGRVGIIQPDGRGQIRTLELAASEDGDLGLNMPGILLDDRELATLGGTPSDEMAMYFADFADLEGRRRTEFRAVALGAAPSAYPLQNDPLLDSVWGMERPRVHLLAFGLGLVGCAVMFVVLMLGFLGASSGLRLALVAHGANHRVRRRLSLRILTVPLAACLLAPVMARLTLWVMQQAAIFNFSSVGAGWRWPVPGVVGFCVILVFALRFARAPRKDHI